MRWGLWAGLHAALVGVIFCLASGAGARHYVIYAAGNLLSLAALAYIRAATAEGIRQSAAKSLLLALAVTLLMQLGRALLAVVLGYPAAAATGFFTTDVITLLFTLVLIWIARRLDGIFEEQNHYLLRLRQEKNKERGGY
jgi:heme A synthase